MRNVLIPTLLIAGALSACGQPWEGEGTVVGREYDDPDSGVYPGYVIPGHTSCSSFNNVTTCHTTAPVIVPPIPWHDGPHWILVVEYKDRKGKLRTAKPHVSEHLYNNCPDGRWYSTETQECTLR